MATGDSYKLEVIGAFNFGQQFVHSLHYRQTLDFPGSTGAEQVINAWRDDCEAAFLATVPVGSGILKFVARGILGNLEQFEVPVTLIQGTRAGDPLPPNAPPIISWRTGLFGRRNRGRSYMPSGVETDQSAGEITVGFSNALSAYATTCQNITASVLGDTFEQVVFSKTGLVVNPVTGFIVRGTLATQRRRRLGTGA